MSLRHTTPVPGSTADSPIRDHHGAPTPDLLGTAVQDHEPIRFMKGYDDPSAEVVLVGSDRIGLRVKDYYLKAASEFFRGMLEAGTRGGVVPLDATSLQLKFLMDRVTGGNSSLDTLKAIASKAPVSVIGNSWQALYSLMELDNIANKYLFPQVSQYIHLSIAAYAGQNPPAALLHACRSSPVNGAIATAALKAFRDEMPSWMGQYFQKSSWKTEPSGHIHFAYLPAAYNLHTDFAEALGLRAFLAYTRALEYGSSTTINNDGSGNVKTVSYNWESVARRFAEEAKTSQQVRSRFLHHEDDAASDWFPSTPPRETSLSPYQSSVPLVETPIPGMTPPPG